MPVHKPPRKQEFIGTNIPTLVTLRKGEKVNNIPKELDYFRADSKDFISPEVENAFRKLYGDKPTEFRNVIVVWNPYGIGDLVDQMGATYMEEYGANGRCTRRCNLVEQLSWRDKEGVVHHDDGLSCQLNDENNPCQCKITKHLTLFFPDLVEASGVFGAIRLTLRTDSEDEQFRFAMQTQPSLIPANPPLMPYDCRWHMRLSKTDTYPVVNGKASKVPHNYVVWAIDMENTMNKRALLAEPSSQNAPQLPATISDPETGEIMEDEKPIVAEVMMPDSRTTRSMLNDLQAILADGSRLAEEWYQQDINPNDLEVLLLDELVENKTPVTISDAVVIDASGKPFYALDFGFNQNKLVILMKTPMQKGDKVGKRVTFKGMVATLEKTNGGNYAATPIS